MSTELLNVRRTAEVLGVHENTIRNWEKSGLLRGVKLPGSGFRRFPREEVERMRSELMSSYAPATELPEQTAVTGTVVSGDVL
ncbi:MAG TPA: helix-turn-helix domain-containing protein [Solirubrobacteraceae bacterium]|jgi:excisionase family DNA binding protein|nr:helix-turn-helix domain-containing protein [Solirubrobacteraceae bacterium]